MRPRRSVLVGLASRRLSAGLAGLLALVCGHWKIEHLHWLPSPGVLACRMMLR
jgi:hypothetical protein